MTSFMVAFGGQLRCQQALTRFGEDGMRYTMRWLWRRVRRTMCAPRTLPLPADAESNSEVANSGRVRLPSLT